MMPTENLCGYVSSIPLERVRAFEQIERNRQDLMDGRATPGARAYAEFLSAVESDATYSHGGFGRFAPDKASIERQWPFLSEK